MRCARVEMQVDMFRWLPTPAAKTASTCWIACSCSISCGNNLTNSLASQTSFSPRSLKMMGSRARATFLAVSSCLTELVAAQCCLHVAKPVPVTSLHQHCDIDAVHMLVQPICANIYILILYCLPSHFFSIPVVMIGWTYHILLFNASCQHGSEPG